MNVYYYDEPYLTGREEQREFGWITSKLIRPMKASIGRTRRKLADKLYESGMDKAMEAQEKAANLVGVKNKTLRNNILRVEAPKAKTTVSYRARDLAGSGGGGATIARTSANTAVIDSHALSSPFIEKSDKDLLKKILKKRDRASGIAMDPTKGEEFLAHELGHAKGKVSGGIRGFISRSDPRFQQGYEGSLSRYTKGNPATDEKIGFREALKDHFSNLKNTRAIVAEENAASREGLKIMKRNGATKEELAQASKNLKAMGDTYRTVGKVVNRSSLGRLIDIPSRRGAKNIIA